MRIQALIVQNKKGQNIFVISAHDYPHQEALRQSKEIYNQILSSFKSGKRVEKSIQLERNFCLVNVTREAIFIILSSELNLAQEAMKKVCDFFARNMKLELTTRKYQETLLLLEEFLYTKEILVQKLQLLTRPIVSSRSPADFDQLWRFQVSAELERNLIANIPLKYAKRKQVHEKHSELMRKFIQPIELKMLLSDKEQQWFQKSKAFSIKSVFKLKGKAVITENIYKKYTLNQTKKNTGQIQKQCMSISSADISNMRQQQMLAKGKHGQFSEVIIQPPQKSKVMNLMGDEEYQGNQLPQQQISQESPQKITQSATKPQQQKKQVQDINDLLDLDYTPQVQQSQSTVDLSFLNIAVPQLKMLERLVFLQKDGKLKEIKMFGQIALEGDFNDDQSQLQLIGTNWNDSQKRITPNSINISQVNDNTYKMPLASQTFSTSKGIIDYIIPTKCFSQSKVPIVFIYRLEQQQNLASFCLQYKINEQWKAPLFDIEIEVVGEKGLEYEDLKTTPTANQITDNKFLWKSKQVQQKGKFILNMLGLKNQGQILQYIRVSVKSNSSIVEEMDCIMFYNLQEFKSQKRLSIDYKILPNA